MEYDPDDQPLTMGLLDGYWYIANRLAELGMAYARLLGIHETKRKEEMMRCENPHCPNKAETTHRFRDPRRGHGDELAYVRRFCCSPECEIIIVDQLERQAQYARLVN